MKIVTRQHIPDACEDEDPCIYNDFIGDDDLEIWEKVVDGTWAPFKMVANLDCKDMPVSSDMTRWTRSC